MENSEFDKIFQTIAGSNTMIPSKAILSILGGIVNTSGKETEDVKKFAEAVKDCDLTDAISKAVLFTCNSIIINLWNTFGPQFEEAYKKELEKKNTEPVEEKPHQDA